MKGTNHSDPSGRQRSSSSRDECLLDTFVKSTVQFKSNLKFVDEKSMTINRLAKNILLIGTESELKHSSVQKLPFYSPIVAHAIQKIKEDQTVSVLTQLGGSLSGFVTVTIVAVPTRASRNNCPLRPDCYAAAVHKAVSTLSGDEPEVLDIFVRAPAAGDAAIITAIARGCPHSFSEKKGLAEKSFLNQRVTVNVVFAERRTPLDELERLSTAIQLCQRLVDAPTDILSTVVFAEIAEAYGRQLGVRVTTIMGDALREKGYGGIFAVGKAAEFPPALVTLQFTNPKARNGKKIALVGKGLVYDCGGLSIKTPSTFMSNMKTDMAGAAAVFSAFVAIVGSMKAGSPAYAGVSQLSVTLCLAENSIGSGAYRNDDILRLKSGKTVEVFNTDAEGRICLGDGVFHASNEQEFTPDILIDMATLTGAQGIATGLHHAAIYTNNEEAETEVVRAGKRIGDVCFPVLYCPEYHEQEYKSNFADMRNLMKVNTNAGVSCGGYFVESHLSEKFKGTYIHVDLAFPSSNDHGGTGYGVALLAEYLKK